MATTLCLTIRAGCRHWSLTDELLPLRQALARSSGGLVAVLRLAATDYEANFELANSKQEFQNLLAQADEVVEVPQAHSRAAAYEAAGEWIVDNCEVLVTVWDDQGESGSPGVLVEAGLPDLAQGEGKRTRCADWL